eukprot:scaffold75497_cov33-Tisochrysis_lutea.AAC.1
MAVCSSTSMRTPLVGWQSESAEPAGGSGLARLGESVRSARDFASESERPKSRSQHPSCCSIPSRMMASSRARVAKGRAHRRPPLPSAALACRQRLLCGWQCGGHRRNEEGRKRRGGKTKADRGGGWGEGRDVKGVSTYVCVWRGGRELWKERERRKGPAVHPGRQAVERERGKERGGGREKGGE